jgi:multicomponent Na+:H+ antiporter subunit G
MSVLVSFFILAGAVFVFLAALGILRFSTVLSRMHATSKALSFGLLLLLIGVAIIFNTTAVYVKAFMVIAFVYLTAPLAAHAIAKAWESIHEDKNL